MQAPPPPSNKHDGYAVPPTASAMAAPPPSIDRNFQYLSFGGTFNRTLSLFSDRLDLFMALSAVVLVPFLILLLSSTLIMASILIRQEKDYTFHPRHVPLIAGVTLVEFVVYELSTLVGRGAIAKAVADLYLDSPVGNAAYAGGARMSHDGPHWYPCLVQAKDRLSLLFGSFALTMAIFGVVGIVPGVALILVAVTAHPEPTALAVVVASILTLAAACVAGYIRVNFSLAVPAIMIEPGSVSTAKQSLQRSWELARGSFCYVFCTLFGLWFANNLLQRLLNNMFLNGSREDATFTLAGLVVIVVPMLIFVPLHGILETVIYLNLRIGRESLDRSVLTSDLQAAPGNNASAMNSRNAHMRIINVGEDAHDLSMSSYAAPKVDYRQIPLMDGEVTSDAKVENV